jgi:hypothetical protein
VDGESASESCGCVRLRARKSSERGEKRAVWPHVRESFLREGKHLFVYSTPRLCGIVNRFRGLFIGGSQKALKSSARLAGSPFQASVGIYAPFQRIKLSGFREKFIRLFATFVSDQPSCERSQRGMVSESREEDAKAHGSSHACSSEIYKLFKGKSIQQWKTRNLLKM